MHLGRYTVVYSKRRTSKLNFCDNNDKKDNGTSMQSALVTICYFSLANYLSHNSKCYFVINAKKNFHFQQQSNPGKTFFWLSDH